jgi:hypothetical protein
VNRKNAANKARRLVVTVMQVDTAALNVWRSAGFLARERQPGTYNADLTDRSEKRCCQ